jgi:hypothetical protein
MFLSPGVYFLANAACIIPRLRIELDVGGFDGQQATAKETNHSAVAERSVQPIHTCASVSTTIVEGLAGESIIHWINRL